MNRLLGLWCGGGSELQHGARMQVVQILVMRVLILIEAVVVLA